MVHKFQELENYDDYDPVPYQGGYDQAAAYGSVKPADGETGYQRSTILEDEQEQVVQYGNEKNPYGRGHPGPSVYGGEANSKPGAVYGGGRDRTRPSYDEAKPDEGVETGNGRRKPVSESESGYRKPYSYGEEDGSGYHKPYSYVEVEESGYSQEKPQEEESAYRKAGYGYEKESSGYPRPTFVLADVDESGYRKPLFYGYGEESWYSKARPSYNEGENEDSVYRKPYYGYGEESVYTKPEENPRPYGEVGGAESGYRQTGYGREDDYSTDVRSTYGEEDVGYGGYGHYGEEVSGYGGGYGGCRTKPNHDDDLARFGGGSVYTVVVIDEIFWDLVLSSGWLSVVPFLYAFLPCEVAISVALYLYTWCL